MESQLNVNTDAGGSANPIPPCVEQRPTPTHFDDEPINAEQLKFLDRWLQQPPGGVPVIVPVPSPVPNDNVLDNEAEPEPAFNVKFVSANVQKSAENTTQLLERYRDANVIYVQEIFWGHIKNVLSSKKKDGDLYENTTAHRNFTCFGVSSKSRVATYMHRCWRGASPHIITGLAPHGDCLMVSFGTPQGTCNVLNVYNDNGPNNVISHLLEHVDSLPPITMMAGDFNLHHVAWDKVTRNCNENPPHGGNDPEAPATWKSNNPRSIPTHATEVIMLH
ncbi:hypothetical protein EVJ58_g8044 [Rhodofomes roseus]|uniref:Uncharacterized protein n=1 Tax=Rhodofomes roseus TaxID=34475 RepID=A0A4Y9Y1I4_9APHY|nr:hypothetical protein EVJ58_g8044 [Rhodofomes roseus]